MTGRARCARVRRPGGPVALVIVLVLALAGADVRAAVQRYPGASPCNLMLQDCISAASVGDTIEIATNAPIDENLEIVQSLTLTAARGFTPFITGNSQARVVSIVGDTPPDSGEGPPGMTVTLSHLTLNNAFIAVALSAGSAHRIEITDCDISHAIASSDARGIDLDVRVPASILLRKNVLLTTGKPIRIFTALADGVAEFMVRANQLSASNPTLSNSGIALDHRGTGTTTTNLYSNLIHDVSGCNCSSASGIDVSAVESARATVNVINNTLDGAKAIQVRAPASTAQLTVNVFNNIVHHTAGFAVKFPSRLTQLTINNGFNDLVSPTAEIADFGGYLPGPGTFNRDPLFIGNGNYHLRNTPTQSMIDKGTLDPPGGLPSEDADGYLRVAGVTVDLGAFEFGSSAPVPTTTTTSTVTTTSGPTTSSTTSTTIPVSSCTPVPTFLSIACRLSHLTTQVMTQVPVAPLNGRLLALLAKATAEVTQAEQLVTPGSVGPARGALGRAVRAVSSTVARLNSRQARTLPGSLRSTLRGEGLHLRSDLKALRRSL